MYQPKNFLSNQTYQPKNFVDYELVERIKRNQAMEKYNNLVNNYKKLSEAEGKFLPSLETYGSNWQNAASYDLLNNQANAYYNQLDAVKKDLDDNAADYKYHMGDDEYNRIYNNITKSIGQKNITTQYMQGVRDDYSKFKSREDYEDNLALNEEIKNTDLEALGAQIGELEWLKKTADFVAQEVSQLEGRVTALSDKVVNNKATEAEKEEYNRIVTLELPDKKRELNSILVSTQNKYNNMGALESDLKKKKQLQSTVTNGREALKIQEQVSKLYQESKANEDWDKLSTFKSTAKPDNVTKTTLEDYGKDLILEYINGDKKTQGKITSARKADATGGAMVTQGNALSVPTSAYDWSQDGLDQLDANERKLATYLYYKDRKKFDEYLETMKPVWIARGAEETAKKVNGNFLLTAGYAVGGAFDRFLFESLPGLANMITGKEEVIEPTKTQLTSQAIRQNLSGVSGFLYDVADTAAYMAPSMIANMAAPGSGFALTGLSAAGSAYNEGIASGMDVSQARFYAGVIGGLEAGLSYALGGAGNMLGKVTKTSVSAITSQLKGAASKFVLKVGVPAFSEGLEEGLQEFFQPIVKNLVSGTDHEAEEINWENVGYSALLGFFTGGITQVPSAAKNAVVQKVTEYSLGKSTLTFSSLEDIGSLAKEKGFKDISEKLNKLSDSKSAFKVGKAVYRFVKQAKTNSIEQLETALLDNGATKGGVNSAQGWANQILNAALAKQNGTLPLAKEMILRNNAIAGPVYTDFVNNGKYGGDVLKKLNSLIKPVVKSVKGVKSKGDTTSTFTEKTDDGLSGVSDEALADAVSYYREHKEVPLHVLGANKGTSLYNALSAAGAINEDGTVNIKEIRKEQNRRNGAGTPTTVTEIYGKNVADKLEQERPAPKKAEAEKAAEKTREKKITPEEEKIVKAFGKDNGLNIIFTDELVDGIGNGKYDNGNTIYISRYSSNPIEVVLKHEFTHSVEGSKLYENFSKYVFENSEAFNKWLNDKGYNDWSEAVANEIEKYKTYNVKYKDPYVKAKADVIANFVSETLFNKDGKISENFLSELRQADRNLWQRFVDFIKGIFTRMAEHGVVNKDVAKLEQKFLRLVEDARNQRETSEQGETEQGKYSVAENKKITPNMAESERANILRDAKLDVVDYVEPKDTNIDFEFLETAIKSKAEKHLFKKLKSLGYLKNYTTNALDVEFSFTMGGLRKSSHSQLEYGGNYSDFAKVVVNIQELLDSSLLIETHTDKGKGTSKENPQLKQVYVLLSALKDNKNIIPVQFEVKEFVDNNNRLYLAVALTKIEIGVMGNTIPNNSQVSTNLLPISSISIPELFSKINPKDKKLLKYVPDEFLNKEQKAVKQEELKEDDIKYGKGEVKYSLPDISYLSAVESGDMETAQKMVDEAAKKAGYDLKLYHGTKDFGFTEFSTNKSADGLSVFTSESLETAEDYSKTKGVRQISQTSADTNGNYALYGKSKNLLEVDAQGAEWNRIPTPDIVDNAMWQIMGTMKTHDIAQYAKENNYIGVKINNVIDGGKTPSNVVVYFDSSNLKSADPVTYDDNGNVIPLSKRFNKEETDIRYSLPDIPDIAKGKSNKELSALVEDGEITVDEALAALSEQYGTMPKGENPKVDVDVPNKVSKNQKVRRYGRTALESGHLTEGMSEQAKKEMLDGALNYRVVSNQNSIDTASKKIETDINAAINEWEGIVKSGKIPTAKDITLAEMLMVEAAKDGNENDVALYLSEIAALGTQLGQSIQALSLLKKLSGAGHLNYISRVIAQINQDLENRYGAKFQKIVELKPSFEKILKESKDPKEIEAVVDDILTDVAKQMPSTWTDKLKAWRYLAMLGNTRTHIRNFFGNAIFLPAIRLKDTLSAVAERMFIRDQNNRTKVFKVKEKYRNFAKEDFENVKELITNGGKMSPSDKVQDRRKIFTSKAFAWLESFRQFNFKAMEIEDLIFLKRHYIHSLGSILQAKGTDIESISETELNKFRDMAIKEAQKATYRDFSNLANVLNKLANPSKSGKGGTDAFNKAVGVFVEGALPFKKTPINILKRGIEYSPLGIATSLYNAFEAYRRGEYSGAELIDGLTAGMTGTMILALGMALRSMGIIVGGLDYEDEDALERLSGAQPYALQFGDISFTIDWLAPVSLPFLIGAEIQSANKNGENLNFFDALTTIGQPLTELSFLSGINDIIEGVAYSGKDSLGTFGEVATNLASSYISQYFPTALGQVARTIDPVSRTNFVDKSSGVPSTIQKTGQKILGKIPWASATKTPYVDAWGRTEETESVIQRAFENFISPGYVSTVKEDKVNNELARLYVKTGEGGVIPKRAGKSFEVNGETVYLNADAYVQYAVDKGQYSRKYLDEFLSHPMYKTMDDADKANVISNLYSYANAKAKSNVSDYDYTQVSTYKTAAKLEAAGFFVIDYYIAVAATSKENADKDGSGGVSKAEKTEALKEVGFNKKQIKTYLEVNKKKK